MADLERARLHAAHWQHVLRLTEWRITVSDQPPDDADERASCNIDRTLHAAIIRLDPTTPDDQLERDVVHEVMHCRLAEMEDAFRQVHDDDESVKTWWHRSMERTIEALVDALLPDQPRREWRGQGVWIEEVA